MVCHGGMDEHLPAYGKWGMNLVLLVCMAFAMRKKCDFSLLPYSMDDIIHYKIFLPE